MSGSASLPPAYEEVEKTSSHHCNPNWEAWYRQLITLDFSQDEAVQYAKLFASNDVELSMIPELSDSILKAIGIEKAGHRIRILRLQRKNSVQTLPRAVAAATSQTAFNAPRCASHPNIVANEKCYKCHRLLCLNCRREKSYDSRTRYYCKDCQDECIIL